MESRVTAAQSAAPGQPVAEPPSVRVLDETGAPAVGVEVRFEVVAGGGDVASPVDTTDAAGIATAGGWTLGANPGSNEVVANAASLPSVRFEAVAVAMAASYTIEVRYLVPVSGRQAQAVEDAVDRWQSAIRADLTDVPVSVEAGACFSSSPLLSEVVDDLLIYVEFVDIDGVGGILGQAGPCFIRTGSALPIVGHVKLDRADLLMMETKGTIDDVVLHEIGHVLGIGTLWGMKNLTLGVGGTDPRFTGADAALAYGALGGAEPDVPIENTGGAGTRDAHWRESTFGSELMTGFIGSTPNPLSAMTIGSLTDLGYGVDGAVAADYTLGMVRSAARQDGIDLGRAERVKGPRFEIDPAGRKFRYH